MQKYLSAVIIIFMVSTSAFAQMSVTGIVLDYHNQSPLQFVNIGIKNKNTGTCSKTDGNFSILIPAINETDTLTFSMIGYAEENIPIKTILKENQTRFVLKQKPANLATVNVSARRLTEKKFGLSKYHPLFHILDGSMNQHDIFEIAQLIRMDTNLSRITSVNLHVNEERRDSGTFRINFYGFDGKNPTERIIESAIVQTHAIQPGWLSFDLRSYPIYLKGNFVVAIEFIPTGKTNDPISYEVKLGGSARSFVRTSSQGEWNIPPHHYRLFITALVPYDKDIMIANDLDEVETLPITSIYSESIGDSFSVFVRLPENYEKNTKRTYPVVYLLDANAYFDLLSSLMNAEPGMEIILVGIGYGNFILMDSLRNRDYTFPQATASDSFPISGGADKFLRFIKQELIPYVGKHYRTDSTRMTLMGHSLGGYFTLFAMATSILDHQVIFNNYVAASPSLEYGDDYLVKRFQNIGQMSSTLPCSLNLSFGAREDAEDGIQGSSGIDRFNSFVNLLSGIKSIHLKNEIFPGLGHMQTAIPAFTKELIDK